MRVYTTNVRAFRVESKKNYPLLCRLIWSLCSFFRPVRHGSGPHYTFSEERSPHHIKYIAKDNSGNTAECTVIITISGTYEPRHVITNNVAF